METESRKKFESPFYPKAVPAPYALRIARSVFQHRGKHIPFGRSFNFANEKSRFTYIIDKNTFRQGFSPCRTASHRLCYVKRLSI